MPSSKRKIAVYLRRIQGAHGGWPLFHDGDFDMSASVKAYFALKMIGDDTEAEHMRRAREAILARGGAARQQRVHARAAGALRRHAVARVPVMPVEIMLLPKWFPFHLDKISYWARTVIVPLLVLQALKPRARNPQGRRASTNCSSSRRRASGRRRRRRIRNGRGSSFFRGIDVVLRASSRYFRRHARKRAIDKAVAFVDRAAQRRGRARRDLPGDGQLA